MKKQLFLALGLCASAMVFAQETPKVESLDSVFINTKIRTARKNSGKVVVTLTSDDLARSAGKSVAEILNEVSGIEINGSRSNDGQNLGYFVRGGRNRQVVIMVDGVQLNDPSSIANDFDLRLLNGTNLERIEIVKGASSVLYGSGAATAVINITTKNVGVKPFSATLTSTLGTNEPANSDGGDLTAFTNNINVNGTAKKFFYAADFGHRSTKGLSAIAPAEGEAPLESDDFDNYNAKLRLGYKINDKVQLSRFIGVDQFEGQFDDFSFIDANNLTESEQIRTGGNFRWRYKKGQLIINDSHSWLDREITSSFPAMYDAKSSTIDAYGSYRIRKGLTAILGVNANFSSFNSFTIPFGGTDFMQDVDEETARFDIIDPYLSLNYESDFGLNVNAGARLNNHSEYGTHVVYNINPSYNHDLGEFNLKGLASLSTAYITPSLFQLHDPVFGNLLLEPEENTTIEGGLELTKGKNLRLSAVYFTRNEKNFVDFVTVDPVNFIFQYQNIADEFDASGVEVEFFGRWEDFTFSANYTNTQADERFALRIPEHKINSNAGYLLKQKTYFGLGFNYTSERNDVYFDSATFESVTTSLDAFGLVNLDVSHQFNETIKVFANVSNLLDEEYEELFRFQTRGRNFRLGLTLNF